MHPYGRAMAEFTPYYAQLFGIGLLWVTFHCAGMCGPIIASLTASTGVHRTSKPGVRLWRATKGVLAYQSGRAVVYAALGATAGLAGAGAQALIEDLAKSAGLVVAMVLLGAGVAKLVGLFEAGSDSAAASRAARLTGWLMRWIGRRLPPSPPLRMAAFGLALGLLPCVLMFWVLGIAASTASAVHGAAIMVLLVAMTTPVLILAACGTSLPGLFAKLRANIVIGAAMMLSGSWLLAVAAAANGWIGHLHIPFELFGHEFVIMLW